MKHLLVRLAESVVAGSILVLVSLLMGIWTPIWAQSDPCYAPRETTCCAEVTGFRIPCSCGPGGFCEGEVFEDQNSPIVVQAPPYPNGGWRDSTWVVAGAGVCEYKAPICNSFAPDGCCFLNPTPTLIYCVDFVMPTGLKNCKAGE